MFNSIMRLGSWKNSSNIGYFLIGSFVLGIAMGMGNSFGTMLMKSSLKGVEHIAPGTLPPMLKEEVMPSNS